jgi:hypothetical protein
MHTEIVSQINQLPLIERLEIIEEVSRELKRELGRNERPFLTEEQKKVRLEAVEILSGIASVTGKRPPTDQEIKDGYGDYLVEKYK